MDGGSLAYGVCKLGDAEVTESQLLSSPTQNPGPSIPQ